MRGVSACLEDKSKGHYYVIKVRQFSLGTSH